MNKYDVAVVQSDGGISIDSFKELLEMVNDEHVLPLDLEANHAECSAIGVISVGAAERLDYDYEKLRLYLGEIMDDMDKESENGEYEYEGLKVFMGYERMLSKEMTDYDEVGRE